jgi:hypothetical protein
LIKLAVVELQDEQHNKIVAIDFKKFCVSFARGKADTENTKMCCSEADVVILK